jgi:hypothetical protein
MSAACVSKQRKYRNPPHYNLNKPYVIKLPAELNEISGMAYYAKDNSLFVESDNKGSVYKVLIGKQISINKWKFGHKINYEDIVVRDSTFYVLNSTGDLYAVRFGLDSPIVQKFEFPRKGNEFESLYYDDSLQKLVIICKDCKLDNHNSVSTYTFDIQSQAFEESYVINSKKVMYEFGPDATRLKPSAATIHPITKDLYLLSSVNKLLLIANRDGKIREMYSLNPRIYNHPEGITFTPAGDMFISNEAARFTPATILYFKFNKNGD